MGFFSFSFPTQIVFTSIIHLSLFLLASFLKIGALSFLSLFFYFSLTVLLIRYIYTEKKLGLSSASNLFIGWALVGVYSLLLCVWFKDIWVAPSNDDTINHLGFLEAIINSKNILLGNIERPGSEFLGVSHYHFYPTGAHGLASIWFSLFDDSAKYILKYALLAVLAFYPGFLWWGSVNAFPVIHPLVRLFLVVSAATLPIFPLSALGEGGFSRIIAGVLMVPVWFEFVNIRRSPKSYSVLWTAIIMILLAPSLLFVHPSLFVLIGFLVIFLPIRIFFAALAGSIFGTIYFYFIYSSAHQEVMNPEFIQNLVSPIRNSGWFQRLKGPFHYWFTDPSGFGKFFSPKNYLIYLALFLSVVGKTSRKGVLLFLAPFFLAALAMIPHPVSEKIGLVFYHSVKRIAELLPLLGFTLALLSAEWISIHRARWLKSRPALNLILILFMGAFVFQFQKKSSKELNHFNSIFFTPKTSSVNALMEKIQSRVKNEDVLLIDQHSFDAIRFERAGLTLTIIPECAELGEKSDYCQNRHSIGRNFLEHTKSIHKEVWWMPSEADLLPALQLANQQKLETLKLNEQTYLIHIPGSTNGSNSN